MQRELTYDVSRERLAALGRTMNSKLYGGGIWSNRLLIWAAVFGGGGLAAFNGPKLSAWLGDLGIPVSQNFIVLLVLALIVAGWWDMRRLAARREAAARQDFVPTVRMTQDEGGLRFANKAMENYLKWEGIERMLLEPDGVVVLCAGSFWFIPDAAFRDAGERRAFIQDVYGRLSEEARALSEAEIRPALAG